MKFTISALLLLAAVCAETTLAASSKGAKGKEPMSVATLQYAGADCKGALLHASVRARTDESKPCASKCTDGIKTECVSSNSKELYVRAKFASKSTILYRQYADDDSACTGKPVYVRGELADGQCFNGQKRTINPDRSVTYKQWAEPSCPENGVIAEDITMPKAENNGQCTRGVTYSWKYQTLGKVSGK